MSAIGTLLDEVTEERDRYRAALEKINRIRNIVTGTQSATWSNSVYPMVAALNEAGLEADPKALEAAEKGLAYGPGCVLEESCSVCGSGATYGKVDVNSQSFKRCLCTCHHPSRKSAR